MTANIIAANEGSKMDFAFKHKHGIDWAYLASLASYFLSRCVSSLKMS